jgi:cation transport ATPase
MMDKWNLKGPDRIIIMVITMVLLGGSTFIDKAIFDFGHINKLLFHAVVRIVQAYILGVAAYRTYLSFKNKMPDVTAIVTIITSGIFVLGFSVMLYIFDKTVR